jgi:hypothetical protein
MAYYLVTKEDIFTVITTRGFPPQPIIVFAALKQNFGGYRRRERPGNSYDMMVNNT